MGKYLMIADDFTGSADAGVQMAKRGIESHIIFNLNHILPQRSYVIDSETRNVTREEASAKIKKIYSELQEIPYDYHYMKIDSTMRGNITTEIIAADAILKPDLIVFNPANPNSYRIVRDGTLYLNGKRLLETEIANDPLCTIESDHLVSFLKAEIKESIQFFSLSEIRRNQLKLDGSHYLTFDVETNADMKNVIKAILKSEKKVLWVGSAGMANILLDIVEKPKPVLTVVGSISDTSRSQIETAVNAGVNLVKIDSVALLKGEPLQKFVDEACSYLKDGHDVMVASSPKYQDYLDTIEYGNKLNMTRQSVSQFVQKQLGILTKEILKRIEVQGLILTGGDTAISVIEHNHATGARLIQEVLPVVALVTMDAGDHPDLPCIVKGGSIGDADAIVKSIHYLHNQ